MCKSFKQKCGMRWWGDISSPPPLFIATVSWILTNQYLRESREEIWFTTENLEKSGRGKSNRKQETLGLDTRNHFKTTIYGFLLLTFWQAKFFATIQVLIRKAGIMEFSHNLSVWILFSDKLHHLTIIIKCWIQINFGTQMQLNFQLFNK